MNTGKNKVISLSQAIGRYVTKNCHISIGGFTISRNPMAAVHEIIRQKIKNLHIYAHSNGQGLDELIGAGCISKAEIAYAGNGRFAPTCICFKRHSIENKIMVEDYTNFQMALRFMAGAMGVPFLPTYSSLGTDIIKKWGFNPNLRKKDTKLASQKAIIMENPFARTDPGEKVVLVPAINPDVTIIHAQTADATGTTRMDGLTFCDVDQAKAARHTIVTCEKIAAPGELSQSPQNNQLPSFCVDAVVHLPFGAYPTACYGQYDYDVQFFNWYKKIAADQSKFDSFIKEYIMSTDHSQFIEKACGPGISQILADPETGYSNRTKKK
ncbi:MAG: CoA transferase subunit A [Desulfobacteraceae bacterium]|nr:CoA transferase subunit A [Desulfobacteraceae bacterium]